MLAALAALVLAPAVPAAAAPSTPAAPNAPTAPSAPAAEAATAAARPGASPPHCVLAAGGRQSLRCFATFPAAIAAATGGRVTTAPATPAVAVRDPAFTAALEAAPTTTLASYVVGIEYADINYTGASLTMIAGRRCDDSLDVDHRFASMPSGWNDRITSFRSYSNCAQQLFRGTNFSGGALTNIVSSSSWVGSAANDQASSATFN